MGELSGKTAIITGAASGIGRATAELFAREGASLLLVDVDRDGLERGVASAVEKGARALARVADVSDDAAVMSAVAECCERLGVPDIAHANAGIVGRLAPVLELEPADWQAALGVNLLGTASLLKHAGREMVERGSGAIVCTASVAGLRAGAGPAHYSASKAAIINLVRVAASQLAGTGVRVNAVCPGLIETGMTQPLFDMARAAGKEHKIGQLNPTKRAGSPDEIARAVLFLASDASSYVNGEALVVDGGLSASHPAVPGKLW